MLSMAIEGGKTAGWPIPPAVKEAFTTFCKEVGSLAKDDCAGALFIWQYLPGQIREWAKLGAKGIDPVGETFWDQFHNGMEAYMKRGFLQFLGATSETEKETPRDLIGRLRIIADSMTEAEYLILSADEQKIVDEIRREVGPLSREQVTGIGERVVARVKEQRGKVHPRKKAL